LRETGQDRKRCQHQAPSGASESAKRQIACSLSVNVCVALFALTNTRSAIEPLNAEMRLTWESLVRMDARRQERFRCAKRQHEMAHRMVPDHLQAKLARVSKFAIGAR
jgi:hypothetical protein